VQYALGGVAQHTPMDSPQSISGSAALWSDLLDRIIVELLLGNSIIVAAAP